ncbi:MAG: hypothetical protein KDE53_20470 [Caldilineaceae bacterium]|nr:hypothetical protein [Caldilineaceae bacterium]MCB0124651.1 hypothetical protein [Caldilineaceae bacterium]
MARRDFEYLSELYDIETIAQGTGVRARHILNRQFGKKYKWFKKKGKALIQYSDGRIVEAEIHWFEARGIGRVDEKSIKELN